MDIIELFFVLCGFNILVDVEPSPSNLIHRCVLTAAIVPLAAWEHLLYNLILTILPRINSRGIPLVRGH